MGEGYAQTMARSSIDLCRHSLPCARGGGGGERCIWPHHPPIVALSWIDSGGETPITTPYCLIDAEPRG